MKKKKIQKLKFLRNDESSFIDPRGIPFRSESRDFVMSYTLRKSLAPRRCIFSPIESVFLNDTFPSHIIAHLDDKHERM